MLHSEPPLSRRPLPRPVRRRASGHGSWLGHHPRRQPRRGVPHPRTDRQGRQSAGHGRLLHQGPQRLLPRDRPPRPGGPVHPVLPQGRGSSGGPGQGPQVLPVLRRGQEEVLQPEDGRQLAGGHPAVGEEPVSGGQ